MKETKLCHSIEDAIRACGLRDGMTVDFNHHLRDGDYVIPMVMNAIGKLGIKDIKVFSAGIFNGMMNRGLTDLIHQGVITSTEVTGNSSILGGMISRGELPKVCRFHTHGGRARTIVEEDLHIDVCFVAAPTADCMGNCNGVEGPNAFGSIGYSMSSSRYADKTVVITDNLVPYPLQRTSIDESVVDYVVQVDAIGDPNGIATGIAKPTKDPLALIIAEYASKTIEFSGLLKDGFSYQAGAGGPSIATTRYLSEIMKRKKVHGSFILGGVTGTSVDLLEEGLFDTIMDVQCFDRKAAASLRDDPRHREISDACYAMRGGPNGNRSCAVDSLDVVVLGALEIDLDFNCNLVVNSSGLITGGAGGHTDTAEGSKMSMIVAPLRRTRYPTVVKKCTSITTPGKDVDVLITEYGISVNPKNQELALRLKDAGLKVVSIEELQALAESMTGIPDEVRFGDRLVAEVIGRNGEVIDRVYNILE